jgi:translation initiation factor 3 subunit I
MGYQCAIRVFDINHGDGTKRQWPKTFFVCWFLPPCFFSSAESKEPRHMFNPIGSKATVCAFTLTPNVIITGHESGKVALFNVKTGEEIENNERAHSDVVTDLQLSKDRTYCITASKDKAARVCDWHIFLVDGLVTLMTLRYTTLKLSW